ncbi:MAG: MtnX-like HAD-IB family phosphatase [Bacteroidota bacterium]
MVRVFCDFDGTAAAEDVGNRLFHTFAGDRASEIVAEYLEGRATARECLRDECAAVGNISEHDLASFVDGFGLDPFFKEFVQFCRSHEIPLTILSDGLDFYVERILKANGLEDIPFFANHLDLVQVEGATRMVPSFPYTDSECVRCGNCKRNHILTLSADDDIVVYVGDGISDRCPVRYADIVFAKKGLIKYCQEQNITYHEYRHFGDVQQRLDSILQKKRIKPRREARMARREVLLQG